MDEIIERITNAIKYGLNQVPHDDDTFLMLAYICTFLRYGLEARECDMHETMQWMCDVDDERGYLTLESVYRYLAKLSKEKDG